jgi:hypothetical protein
LNNPEIRRLIRSFALEMLIYAGLVVGYFFLVLRLLAEPLAKLYNNSLTLYAVLGLVLIVAQAVLLESVTTFIMGLLGLDKVE